MCQEGRRAGSPWSGCSQGSAWGRGLFLLCRLYSPAPGFCFGIRHRNSRKKPTQHSAHVKGLGMRRDIANDISGKSFVGFTNRTWVLSKRRPDSWQNRKEDHFLYLFLHVDLLSPTRALGLSTAPGSEASMAVPRTLGLPSHLSIQF